MSDESAIELFEIESGRVVPTILPKQMTMNFPSPDGRWLIRPRRFRKPNEIEVWNVERGVQAFAAEADLFEFFPDSRRLATMVHLKRKSETPIRIWRIYDLDGARVVTQRRDVLPPKSLIATELLVQEGERILAFARSGREDQDSVDVWSWNEDQMTTIRAKRQVFGYCGTPTHFGREFGSHRREPDFPPRFLVDGRNVIDVATRQQCGALPPEADCRQIGPGWAIVARPPPGPTALRFAKYFPSLVRPLFRSRLTDLSTGKAAATLRTGNDHMARFSPDGRVLIEQGADALTVWKLPPSRPVLAAVLWSLACPLLAGCHAWFRSRRGPIEAANLPSAKTDHPNPWRTPEIPFRKRPATGEVAASDEPAWLADPNAVPIEDGIDLFSEAADNRLRGPDAASTAVP